MTMRPGCRPIVRRALVVVAGALLACAVSGTQGAVADERFDDWDTAVEIEARGNDALQRVRLPLGVLRRSRSDTFADVRVVDAQGRWLPMAWVREGAIVPPRIDTHALPFFAWPKDMPSPAPSASTRIEWTGDGSSLRIHRDTPVPKPDDVVVAERPSDGDPAWLIDLSSLAEHRLTALTLDWRATSATGLVREVSVSASADARQWHDAGRATLVEWQPADPGTGVAATRQVLQRRIALAALPPGARWLRLHAQGPLDLTTITADVESQAAIITADDAFDSVRVPLHADGFDLGAALALRRVDFTWPAGGSVLGWTLEQHVPDRLHGREKGPGRGDARTPWPAWHVAARGTSWHLEREGTWLRSDPVAIDAPAARRWRVVAQPQTPTLPGEITVSWVAPQLVFVASGQGPYRLLIGRAGASDRGASLATLIPGYRRGDEHRLPAATLGRVESRVTAIDRRAFGVTGQRWLLWASLVLAGIVLAGMAWRLARDMSRDPPNDGPHEAEASRDVRGR